MGGAEKIIPRVQVAESAYLTGENFENLTKCTYRTFQKFPSQIAENFENIKLKLGIKFATISLVTRDYSWIQDFTWEGESITTKKYTYEYFD